MALDPPPTAFPGLLPVLVLLLASPLGGGASPEAEIEHAKGSQLEQGPAGPQAMVHLRKARVLDPGNARYLYDLFRALLRRKRHKEAIHYGRMILEQHPESPIAREARLRLVQTYQTYSRKLSRLSRWEEALECLEQALELDPAGPQAPGLRERLTQAYIHLAGLYLRGSQYPLAVRSFEGLHALRNQPGTDTERLDRLFQGQGLGRRIPEAFLKTARRQVHLQEDVRALETLDRLERIVPGGSYGKAAAQLRQEIGSRSAGSGPAAMVPEPEAPGDAGDEGGDDDEL